MLFNEKKSKKSEEYTCDNEIELQTIVLGDIENIIDIVEGHNYRIVINESLFGEIRDVWNFLSFSS